MTLTPHSKALLEMVSQQPDWTTLGPVAFRAFVHDNRQPKSPIDAVEQEDIVADGVPVRLYRSPAPAGSPVPPMLIYYHGGGYVSGSLDVYDRLCARLARLTGCAVASVDYRLAPDHVFPAAVDDALGAARWLLRHGGDHGMDTARVTIGGDSAGGSLAIVVALRLDAAEREAVRHLTLFYPGLDLESDTPSKRAFANGYLLDERFSEMCIAAYIPDPGERSHPDASPLRAAEIGHLPPATLIVGEYDPLRDDILAFARRLTEAGVRHRVEVVPGTFHGFVSFFEVLPEADRALDSAVADLRTALG
ncbi:alpha/beta hydrolase [Novosphingobium aquimarinum]|uniref:alpha/beta hydrolase n=1 Tax=Novosphingobium aquimarinum TaxID=2682494 RepID=UPI0012EC847A|nr:alpha/beta hydrolase [Novosphingobium aquimarinum]